MKNKIFISPTVCYNRNMPQNAEKKSETVLLNLTPTTFDALTRIADFEDRKLGYVARELMIRGLALYEKDGRLRDEAKAATGRKLAPVVASISGSTQQSKGEIRKMLNSDAEREIERRLHPRKRTTVPLLRKSK